MIPYKEIVQSLPFALAYCKLIKPASIVSESIQIEFFNNQFREILNVSSHKEEEPLFLSDALFEDEKKDNLLHNIRVAIETQELQKLKHSSITLKRDCRITVFPLDKTHFILIVKAENLNSDKVVETREELEMTNARMKQMAEFGRIFVWEIDLEGVYNYVGNTVTSILGYATDEIIGNTIFNLHPKKGRDQFIKNVFEDFKKQKRIVDYENPMINKEGRVIWMMTNGFPVFNEQGEIKGYRGFDQDITQMKLSQKALAESEEKYRLLTESVSDIFWVYNNDFNKFTYVSSSIFKLSGYTVELFKKQRAHDIIHPVSMENVMKIVEDGMRSFVLNVEEVHSPLIDIEIIKKDKTTVWVELSFSYRYSENHELEIVGVGRDIQDRKLAQQQLQYVSFHDSLTGLYNRSFYEEEIARLYVKRNLPFSLILADIDDLKLTNDAFGHLEGDILIQEFAKIVKDSCREDDIVARIGGDEFVVLLPKTDEVQTQTILDRINQSIRETTSSKLLMSVAMGSITTKNTEKNFDNLFVEAEEAMYKRKLRNKETQTQDVVLVIENSFKIKHPMYYKLCKDTADHAVALAKVLKLNKQQINKIYYGALFSLIGTLKEPNISIKKEASRVVENGYHLLKQIPEFRDIADIVLSIFEQPNGKGTPQGLANKEIPQASKIIRIALDFCTIKHETSLSSVKALELLKLNVGILYDKKLFTKFRLIEEGQEKNEIVRS